MPSLKDFYIPERVKEVDLDYLEFEEEMSKEEDLKQMHDLLYLHPESKGKLGNPHNSCLLYVTGLSDEFDHSRERCDTIGGSPPDIDMDFEKLRRRDVMQWVIDKWGRERVANIATFQTFKPKSLIDRFYKVTEGSPAEAAKLKQLIPADKHGKAASLGDMLSAHPEVEKKYPEFYKLAKRLEGMVSFFAFHAAGLVITNEDVTDTVPTWKNKEVEKITQWDMKEVESLGLIKFDFLGLVNLDILNHTVQLIKKHRGKELDLYKIEDFDERTYKLLEAGYLEGVFQFETSAIVKHYFADIKPRSIQELSDISSLNRPGPMQAGLDKQYIENKATKSQGSEMPEAVREILKSSHYTLVYQEQVMQLMSTLAGFTLSEADDVRRAMGKKKAEVLALWKQRFLDGCKEKGLVSERYAQDLWTILAGKEDDPNDNGFADYCFDAETLVQTTEGLLSIKDIITSKRQQHVFSFYEDREVLAPVLQKHVVHNAVAKRYVFSDGSEIICSPEQKFLSEKGELVCIEEAFREAIPLMRIPPRR